MKALVFERKELKYAAAAVGSRLSPGFGSHVGPLRLKDIDPPEIPMMVGRGFFLYYLEFAAVILRQ